MRQAFPSEFDTSDANTKIEKRRLTNKFATYHLTYPAVVLNKPRFHVCPAAQQNSFKTKPDLADTSWMCPSWLWSRWNLVNNVCLQEMRVPISVYVWRCKIVVTRSSLKIRRLRLIWFPYHDLNHCFTSLSGTSALTLP